MHNLEYGDDVLMGIFLFECVVKVIAFGFIFAGRTSYIRNSWNVLDFLVICLGCGKLFSSPRPSPCCPLIVLLCSALFILPLKINIFMFVDRILSYTGAAANFTFIRTLRVLRPLKAISGVPGLCCCLFVLLPLALNLSVLIIHMRGTLFYSRFHSRRHANHGFVSVAIDSANGKCRCVAVLCDCHVCTHRKPAVYGPFCQPLLFHDHWCGVRLV
jgi:hypothetical protein